MSLCFAQRHISFPSPGGKPSAFHLLPARNRVLRAALHWDTLRQGTSGCILQIQNLHRQVCPLDADWIFGESAICAALRGLTSLFLSGSILISLSEFRLIASVSYLFSRWCGERIMTFALFALLGAWCLGVWCFGAYRCWHLDVFAFMVKFIIC